MQIGMKHCQADYFVFSHVSDRGRLILIVYVDDIIITGGDSKGM